VKSAVASIATAVTHTPIAVQSNTRSLYAPPHADPSDSDSPVTSLRRPWRP
jgi:hypothetical protein